jgi:hypothetical protein
MQHGQHERLIQHVLPCINAVTTVLDTFQNELSWKALPVWHSQHIFCNTLTPISTTDQLGQVAEGA